MKWATGQQDGGVAVAQQFVNWASDNTTTLANLPDHLKALAVITHFAEIGRGYKHAVGANLYPWILEISQATNAQTARDLWNGYRDRFPPSLKYDEDIKQEANVS